MKNKLFIDLETICTGEPIDPTSLTPPGNIKKQETIDKWFAEEAPKIAEEQYRARALDSMQGEIICIGWAYGEGATCTLFDDKEVMLLKMFERSINNFRGPYKQSFEFVGWNIKSFDLTWIWRKAIQYNLKSLRQSIIRDRYKGNVIDLMEVWASDFRDMRKQSDVAKFLGIPDLSNGIDGSQVYDLYKAGKIKEIAEYCKGDVITTREIYKRIYG